MKIREIILYENSSEVNVLLTIIQYIKNRMEEKNVTNQRVKTDSLINLVRNSGFPAFDYEILSSLFTTNEHIKNHFSNIDDQYVSFSNSTEEEPNAVDDLKKSDENETQNKVSNLAKKALKKN